MTESLAITPRDRLVQSIELQRVNIEKVLPPHLTVDRFVTQVRLSLWRNAQLQQCKPNSVIDAVLKLAELGLDPSGNLGSGYLVPFRTKGELTCTPIAGYRGLIDLAVRSGEVRNIKAEVVYWGDEFDWQEGDKPVLHHKRAYPQTKEEARTWPTPSWDDVRAAYAIATLQDKSKQFCVMLLNELEAVRMRAPGGKSDHTPWATDRIEMYKKCPIRRLVKQLPLSPIKAAGLAKAIEMEEEFEHQPQEEENAPPPKSKTQRMKDALLGEELNLVEEPAEPGSDG